MSESDLPKYEKTVTDRINAAPCGQPLNDLLCGKEIDICYVSGIEGPSIYIDDYRVCGPKPWCGGKVVKRFKVRPKDILRALNLV